MLNSARPINSAAMPSAVAADGSPPVRGSGRLGSIANSVVVVPLTEVVVTAASVGVGVGVGVGVHDTSSVCTPTVAPMTPRLGVGVAVGVFVGVAVGVTVGVFVGVAVGVTVGVFVGVAVGVTVGVFVGVAVGVSVGVAVGVFVAVAVGVTVGVFVAVAVGVAVGVFVGAPVGATVGVFVGVGDGQTGTMGAALALDPPLEFWLPTKMVNASARTATNAAEVSFCFIAPLPVRSPAIESAAIYRSVHYSQSWDTVFA